MKQLKFMLAAVTAISLATASQADDNYNSTNFEDYSEGQFEGGEGWEVPSENYSAIVAGGATGAASYTKYGSDASTHTKALYVETAAKPLLRYIKTNLNKDGALPQEVSSNAKVYIDTMVQFTVTPDGEEPTPGVDDKLMLYAKAVDGNTTLFVIASSVNYDAAECSPVHINTGCQVEKDKWYRLTVEASARVLEDWEEGTQNINLFKIWLDGNPLSMSNPLIAIAGEEEDDLKKIFPSIKGVIPFGDDNNPLPATISSVGFAGEGMVDDLVLTNDDPFEPTTVDFTFTWTTAGITAVRYAIGDATKYTDLGEDKKITDLDPEAIIKIQIEPADWYAVKEDADLKYTASEEEADLDDLVTKLTSKVDSETGDVVINPDNSVTVDQIQEAAGITEGAFYGENTTKDDLAKVLTWKTNKGGADYDINKIAFGVPADQETDDTKAYLLNCSKNELATELAKFKFAGFDPAAGTFKVGSDKMVDDKAAYGNGYVEVRGSSTVDGAYNEAADNSKHYFFKAFLVPCAPVAE